MEWRCFHCGEVLRSYPAAREHFGSTPGSVPSCSPMVVRRLRFLEYAMGQLADARFEPEYRLLHPDGDAL